MSVLGWLSGRLRPAPLALGLALGFPGAALAEEAAQPEPPEHRHRLEFAPAFRRFELADYIGTALVAAAGVVVQFAVHDPIKPRWTGPILFDEAARRAMVASTPDGRNQAIVISNIFWYTPTILPYVESILLPLATDRGNWDVAWQLTAMNLQAAAVNWLVTRSGHRFVARERPDVEPCRKNFEYSKACFSGSNDSFPSGHVSAGMMGAGLVCAHHGNLPLYGGNAGDIIVCGATVAMAIGDGVARIAADRHYATDVIMGALVGLGTGLGLPVLLHYHRFGNFLGRTTALHIEPLASPQMAGLELRGTL
jgi:membrane-associated phospholipid phosphatase